MSCRFWTLSLLQLAMAASKSAGTIMTPILTLLLVYARILSVCNLTFSPCRRKRKTTPQKLFHFTITNLVFFVSDSVLFFHRLPSDSSNSVHLRHKRKAFSPCQVVGSTAYLQQRVLFLQRVQNCFLCTAFNCRLGLVGRRVRHEALTLLHKPSRCKRMYISCTPRGFLLSLELNNTS